MRKLHTFRRFRTKFLKSQYGSGNPIDATVSFSVPKIIDFLSLDPAMV